MRILIVGAGALGGYFGGRLLESDCNVTFLLRPGRAAQLQKTGLIIKSPFGDLSLPPPPHLHSSDITSPFDLIIVGCKAHDLTGVMESIAPAVGRNTAILPMLNGLRHLELLSERFGDEHVLAGQCMISAALDPNGVVLHLNNVHTLTFGERDGTRTARTEAIASVLNKAKFETCLSDQIMQEMWEKWVFIASAASLTSLMRATVGDIVEAGGAELADRLIEECSRIATANGFPPRAAALARGRSILTTPQSTFTASMLKDIERGVLIEADQIVGDLLHRGKGYRDQFSLLHLAYTHLKAYEARRHRETHGKP